MSRKTNHYKQCLTKLQELQKTYPSQSLGMHLEMALSEYGSIGNISDKEFLFALEKYALEAENNIVSEQYVDKIIRDAQNLETLLDDDDDDQY